MSFSEQYPPQPFPQFSNGMDSMGFWPQYAVSNEQSEVNSQFDDHDPPSKRAKNSSDNQSMNHHHNRRSPPVNPLPPTNQPTGRIFYKTRHCLKFKQGICRNGEGCNFAHGDDDLRQPPPNWQEHVSGRSEDRGNGNGNGSGNGNANGNGNGGENWEDDDRMIHKMKLCKKFYNGEECPYGERCNFLHKDPLKFRDVAPPPRFRDSSRESSAISIGTTGPSMPPRAPEQYEVSRTGGNVGTVEILRGNPRPYWKTRTCTKFDTTGFCSFGENCHYAHGRAELLLPGGRPADSEPTTGNGFPAKPVPFASDFTQAKNENGFPANEGGQTKKCLLKWNGTKKINRIYGDWIDDLPLILPNEVES